MEYILASTWERLLKLFHSMVSPNTQNVIHLARRIWTTDLRISDYVSLLQSSALPAELSRGVLCGRDLLSFYSQMCMWTYFLKQSQSDILRSVVQIRFAEYAITFFMHSFRICYQFMLLQKKLKNQKQISNKKTFPSREADLNHRPKDLWFC